MRVLVALTDAWNHRRVRMGERDEQTRVRRRERVMRHYLEALSA